MDEEIIDVTDDEEPHAVKNYIPTSFSLSKQPLISHIQPIKYLENPQCSQKCISRDTTSFSCHKKRDHERATSSQCILDEPNHSHTETNVSSKASLYSNLLRTSKSQTKYDLYFLEENNNIGKMYNVTFPTKCNEIVTSNLDIDSYDKGSILDLHKTCDNDKFEEMDTSAMMSETQMPESDVNGTIKVDTGLVSSFKFVHSDLSSKNVAIARNELQHCRWLQCNRKFAHLNDLVSHVNDAHIRAERDVDYKCYWDNCPRKGKGFNARYKMLIHVRTHTNEKPYKCDICQKSFSRLENLKIHNRSHTGEKPYICPFEGCNKAYSNSSDRFKHVRTHQEQKPYYCRMPDCDKRYTDPSSLRKHIKTHGHHFRHIRNNKSNNKENKNNVYTLNREKEEEKQPATVHSSITPTAPIENVNKDQIHKVPEMMNGNDNEHELSNMKISASGTSPPGTNMQEQMFLPNYIPRFHPYHFKSHTSLTGLTPSNEYNYHLPLKDSHIRKPFIIPTKDEHESKLLSHLPMPSPHPFIGGLPTGVSLPVGNTLLALSSNGLPCTIPTQIIEIRGSMVHISAIGSERVLSHMTVPEYATDIQSASTQTDIVRKPISPCHRYCLSQSTCFSPFKHDGPLDLSNSPSKHPAYFSSFSMYHPVYANVPSG